MRRKSQPVQPPPSNVESLAGLIERVTFNNEETGFPVIKTKVKGHRDLVTVVDVVASINPGEWINADHFVYYNNQKSPDGVVQSTGDKATGVRSSFSSPTVSPLTTGRAAFSGSASR